MCTICCLSSQKPGTELQHEPIILFRDNNGLGVAAMSVSTSPSTPEMTRICLVGSVAQDVATLAAAQSFKLPIVTSDTGAEYIGDEDSITTVFVLNDFEGPVYDAIYKAKQSTLYEYCGKV
uniref:Uncharacterized protein n=1 Tax=Anopheles culicifacies TaxID=139723 RepID=A0A182MAM4_9DIPT